MRPHFLILSAVRAEIGALGAAAARLVAAGWRSKATCGEATVWCPDGAACPLLHMEPGLTILGRALHRPQSAAPTGLHGRRDLSPTAVAEGLLRDIWGDYVAVFSASAGTYLLRDPSGGIDLQTWRTREGLAVATTDLADAAGGLWPARMALNWDRIVAFLNAPSSAYALSLFDDMEVVPPGGLAPLGEGHRSTLAWQASRHIGRPISDIAEAEIELVRRVDGATALLTENHQKLVVELSGGLDSAIVAGAMGACGADSRTALWYNGVGDRPDADERHYARSVTNRLGVALSAVQKPFVPLEEADFGELADGLRPATGGVDAAHDRDVANHIRATGATGLVSGQGGDAAFFQMPTSWLITDLLRRKGIASLWAPELSALARRRRVPVWSLLREGSAGLQQRILAPPRGRLLTRAAALDGATFRHVWEAECDGASLAKQLQVRALAKAHTYHGDSRQARAADRIYPLMAQPVIELCLAIPALDLAAGVQDRPLARRAFRDRLPEEIQARRSKGNLTAYFAGLVAASADMLRPFLLDGVLVAAGVLNREAIERDLDPQALLQDPRPSELLMAAATEAWVRHWQARIPDSPTAAWSR